MRASVDGEGGTETLRRGELELTLREDWDLERVGTGTCSVRGLGAAGIKETLEVLDGDMWYNAV